MIMSALGQKRTLERLHMMSALPPKADIAEHRRDVRFVSKADLCTAAKSVYSITRPRPAGRRSGRNQIVICVPTSTTRLVGI